MKHYPLFKVHVPIEESVVAFRKVIEGGFINEGEQVTQLTKGLSNLLETENLCLVNSCTSAITLALKLSGVKPGDVVVSTPMTCVATNTPIVTMGAEIEWADISSWTGTIDPVSVDKAIIAAKNRGKKVRAVIAVDWAGNLCDYKALRDVCDVHKVKLIRDAAHALMAKYEGKQAHEIPDHTCYSLQAIKHITTGDGGILVCKNKNDHQRAKALKWFGIDRDKAKDDVGNWKGQHWDFDIEEAGYKFNMNNISAAIGLSQLPWIEKVVSKHRANAESYRKYLSKFTCSEIYSLDLVKNSESSHWVYSVKLHWPNKEVRDTILQRLNAAGIAAGVVHVPNHEYTCFNNCWKELEEVDDFAGSQFSLPCGWWMNDDDVKHIVKTMMTIEREYRLELHAKGEDLVSFRGPDMEKSVLDAFKYEIENL